MNFARYTICVGLALSLTALSALSPTARASDRRGPNWPTGKAYEPFEWRGSDEQAAREFWRYAGCVARTETENALPLARELFWDQSESDRASQLARQKGGCLNAAQLKINSMLFKGELSGALFVETTRHAALPDYKSVPWRFSVERFASADPDTNRVIVALVFAECVFRNRSEQVRSLLTAMPYSKDEASKWEAVSPIFGDCLPTKEGVQIGFGKMELRSYLGQAAFLVNVAFVAQSQDHSGGNHNA